MRAIYTLAALGAFYYLTWMACKLVDTWSHGRKR